MIPDLNRLKIFYHVYQHQSVKKASDVLFLTQPGVTKHIQKLEAEIKTPLFIRQHKKMIPTLAADRLYDITEPFLRSLESGIPQISLPMNEPFGQLRISAPLEFGKQYLPGICHEFRKRYDRVSFRIVFEEPDEQLKMLEKGEVDFSILDFFSAKDQFTGRQHQYRVDPLVRETFVLACSSGYFRERMNGSTSFETLLKQDFLTDEHEPVILRHWFWYYFKKPLPELNMIMAIESHPALLECIRLGMGLAITADHLVWNEVLSGKIKTILPKEGQVINQISLVGLKNKALTRTEEVFSQFLKSRLQHIGSLSSS